MTWLRRVLREDRGTSTLEFVVVLPTLLLIFLLGLELSRAWLTAQVAANAVREGARVGVVSPPADVVSAASTKINDVLGSAGLIASAGPTVTCGPPCQTNAQVVASVTVQFQSTIPLLTLFNPGLGTGINIQQTATMRYE